MPNPDTYGIYLHIPYCRSKCRYCDFYSAPGTRGVPDEYVTALLRDFVFYPDDSKKNEAIVCRYPQFFAARLLKQSIIRSVVEKSGKGGTYFGATGCGKTYTMAFLARQLALRCTGIKEIGSPTIIMIVDRDDLQKQGSKLFTKSKDFLNLGEV